MTTHLACTNEQSAMCPQSMLFLFIASSLLTDPQSPTAYQNAAALKAAPLSLIDKATEPHAAHAASVG